jgi:tetratricopeptide (TPR) repeat protein
MADVERAEKELSAGTSPFHKLGLAVTLFLRATLGFEKEIMEQALNKLAEAEEAATEHHRRAVRDPSTAHASAMYPTGAEYALCQAESQLMSAVVAVLNESLTESLRGFYRLRKAFYTLQELSQAEKKYLDGRGKEFASSQGSSSGVLTPTDGGSIDLSGDVEDLKLVDEKLNGSVAAEQLQGNVANSEAAASQADNDIDFRALTKDPIDIFIHSGLSMCFGLLQLLLSMIPPAFARLLSLFSFRGDRETGLRMLWSSTRFRHNINGAIAGLAVLGFHNGAVAFCDIHTKDALPEARLKGLLREMRQLYPKSKLWLLEEARMLGADQNLEKAVELIVQSDKSPLKQVEALGIFERSLNYMYLHRYEECAESFIECVSMNSWSHVLYYYIAGTGYLELYRSHETSDLEKAKTYAEKAVKYFREAPTHLGKKRLMGRQLPFDLYVARKITKWENRAKKMDCSLVDAVGVSPATEMAYFWSGLKRMDDQQLQTSLERLAWSENQPHWEEESADEKAILHVLKGTILRFLQRVPDAKSTLSDGAMKHTITDIKSCEHPDTWPLPVAHYEMAVCLWREAGGETGDKEKLKECSEYLSKVENWESFDLETRIGLKVTTARETLKRCGIGAP